MHFTYKVGEYLKLRLLEYELINLSYKALLLIKVTYWRSSWISSSSLYRYFAIHGDLINRINHNIGFKLVFIYRQYYIRFQINGQCFLTITINLYFNISDSNKLVQYFSDQGLTRAIRKHAELASKYTDVYFYQFSYKGRPGGAREPGNHNIY